MKLHHQSSSTCHLVRATMANQRSLFSTIFSACLLSLAFGVPVPVSEYNYDTVLRLPLPEEIQKLHPHLLHEPITSPFAKIVGGSNAASGSAPYQIALFNSGSFSCGGSFITSNSVLTAAHCVYGYMMLKIFQLVN